MKKIIAICLLCTLCAGTAMARNLVIKKDNQIVAMYSEDQFDEVEFATNEMELSRDIEDLFQNYHHLEICIKVRNESERWNKYVLQGEDCTFTGSGEDGLLTLDFPALENKDYSIPELKFEGMDVYKETNVHRYFCRYEFTGETKGTIPESGEEYIAKMEGYIKVLGGEYNFIDIKIELYVGNNEDPSYKINYLDTVVGIPLG